MGESLKRTGYRSQRLSRMSLIFGFFSDKSEQRGCRLSYLDFKAVSTKEKHKRIEESREKNKEEKMVERLFEKFLEKSLLKWLYSPSAYISHQDRKDSSSVLKQLFIAFVEMVRLYFSLRMVLNLASSFIIR